MSASDRISVHHTATHKQRRVLVTGASGYIGGRLIPELLHAGFTVRATSRNAESLRRFDWYDQVEVAEADLSDPQSVTEAARDVDVLFYLVHSMGGKDEDFEDAELRVARAVAGAAEAAGVGQIVYLSGLHPRDIPMEELSKHMRSRERVAQTLLDSPVPATVYRAATVIGSGSASFEIIRHLTERLPIMLAPQWITNRIEPIAIADVLYYLTRAADLDRPVNRAYDIGCGRTYEFADLLREYGKVRGLKRFIRGLPIPLPMDRLSGAWIGLVTPVPAELAVPLAQSMQEDAVTQEHAIAEIIPDPPGGLTDYQTAVRHAIAEDAAGRETTCWDDRWEAAASAAHPLPTDPEWAGRDVFTDIRSAKSELPVEQVWPVLEGIGGQSGWYSVPLLWRIRGIMDKAVGGPGLGGRRDAVHLRRGDQVDWWRVEAIEAPHRLVLRAEMKLSGPGWLVLELKDLTKDPERKTAGELAAHHDRADGGPGARQGTAGDSGDHADPTEGGRYRTEYVQSAIYIPKGIVGRLYWWAVYPFHGVIFPMMARNILAEARQRATGGTATSEATR